MNSAERYATAYMRVYGARYVPQHIEALARVIRALRQQQVARLIGLPYSNLRRVAAALEAFMKHHALDPQVTGMHALIEVLLERKKIYLLADIAQAVIRQWRAARGIEPCVVVTRHPLTPEEQTQVMRDIQDMWHTIPQPTWKVDPTCIGGISVTSAQRRWDATVCRHLQRYAAAGALLTS